MKSDQAFKPNWVSPPGQTIADMLIERRISRTKFQQSLQEIGQQADDLLSGRVEITEAVARRLENLLGASAGFWLARETLYRKERERVQIVGDTTQDEAWLKGLPLKDMIKFGWLERPQSISNAVESCLQFFDVPSVAAWHKSYDSVLESAAFRASAAFAPNPLAVAAWLRQAERLATNTKCDPWDAAKLKQALGAMRGLSRKKSPEEFVPALQRLAAACGVAFVILRAPTGCRASGATRFLSSKKAMIVLSARYLTDDQLWFSFFHEIGHLLLHGKKDTFVDGEGLVSTKEEKEANEFAANILVPPSEQESLTRLNGTTREVVKFAARIGVAPGIVVGQLQHRGQITHAQLNKVKRRYSWQSE